MKIFSYIFALVPLGEAINALLNKTYDPTQAPIDLRPSIKGRKFSILIKRLS